MSTPPPPVGVNKRKQTSTCVNIGGHWRWRESRRPRPRAGARSQPARGPWLCLAFVGSCWLLAARKAKESQGAARKSQGGGWLFLAFRRAARTRPRFRLRRGACVALGAHREPDSQIQTAAAAGASRPRLLPARFRAARRLRTKCEHCQVGIPARRSSGKERKREPESRGEDRMRARCASHHRPGSPAPVFRACYGPLPERRSSQACTRARRCAGRNGLVR